MDKESGIGSFLKNVTGHNVRKFQKKNKHINPDNTRKPLYDKELKNLKVDRNKARLGAGVAGTAAGGAVGGAKAYNKSGEVNTMDNQQYTDDLYNYQKAAGELMDRLEKTAGEDDEDEDENEEEVETPTDEEVEEESERESEEDSRQGAGSVSNAPAGEDKSASELMNRLEKTAAGEDDEDKEDDEDDEEESEEKDDETESEEEENDEVESKEEDKEASELMKRLEKSAAGEDDGDDHSIEESKAQRVEGPENHHLSGSDIGGAIGGASTGYMGGAIGALGGLDAQGGNLQQAFKKNPHLSLVGAKPNNSILSRLKSLGKGGGAIGLGAGAGAVLGSIPGNIVGSSVGSLKDYHDFSRHNTDAMKAKQKNKRINQSNKRINQSTEELKESKNDDNGGKEASELINRLEKTAAGAGLISKGLSKAKNFVDDATGKNYKKSKESLNAQNSPAALKANAPKAGVANYRSNLERLDKEKGQAYQSMRKARKNSAIAGGAGAAGIAVGSKSKDDNEKEASENDEMSQLYKEAAQAIMDQHIPEVQEHVDPMDRIKF